MSTGPIVDSPSKGPDQFGCMTPGSSVNKQLTGNQEMPDYNKVPEYVELVYNQGKTVATKKITVKIDDWMSEQLDRDVNEEIIQETLDKRNQCAGTNYTLNEWKQLREESQGTNYTLDEWKQRKQQSETNGTCEKYTCVVSLRL